MAKTPAGHQSESLRHIEGYFGIFAADHGLTFGHIEQLPTANAIATICEAPALSGVVLNYGMARALVSELPIGIILQTFGGRPTTGAGASSSKRRLLPPDAAKDLGVGAIAVEIDFRLKPEPFNDALAIVSEQILSAHRCGLDVMLMASHNYEDPSSFLTVIRTAAELGADLVKTPLSDGLMKTLISIESVFEEVSAVLSAAACRILVAGGPVNQLTMRRLDLARSLGMDGFCIGRNIFESSGNAHEIVNSMGRVWRASL